MDKANQVVNTLLETSEKWDNAYKSYKDLYRLKVQAMDTYREMGRAIAYERALAKAGVTKADVDHVITGDQIGATHNYKGKRSAKVCTQPYCSHKALPVNYTECPECGGALTDTKVPYSPSDLRGKQARHIVGVELNDGRYVWFDEMVSPAPWTDSD